MSKFNLITTTEELSSINDDISESQFLQVTSLADITGTSFTRSNIVFNFETNGNQWVDLSESFFRVRMSLTNGAGAQLKVGDSIAPAMHLGGGLFSMIQMEINDRVVSRIDNFVPQIEALTYRLSSSKSKLESQIGFPTWDPKFATRQAAICDDPSVNAPYRHAREYKFKKVFAPPITFDADTKITVAGGNTITIATAAATLGSIMSPILAGTDAYYNISYTIAGILTTASIQITSATAGIDGKTVVLVTAPASSLTALALVNVGPAVVFTTLSFDIYESTGNYQDFGGNGKENFEFLWQPPLSIFGCKHAMPSNLRYRITLTPNQNYQVACVESIGARDVNQTTAAGYKLVMNQMNFYARTYRHVSTDNLRFILDLTSISCQSEILANATNLQQKNFDVPPSTTHLIVAYQNSQVNSNSQFPASKLVMSNTLDTANLDLGRFFLTYAGLQYPQPDADGEFSDTKDYASWLYVQSMVANQLIFDESGWETYDMWKCKGPIYVYKTSKDERSQATRVQLNQSFTGAQANRNVLLFSVYKQVCEISIENAKVASVQLTDR